MTVGFSACGSTSESDTVEDSVEVTATIEDTITTTDATTSSTMVGRADTTTTPETTTANSGAASPPTTISTVAATSEALADIELTPELAAFAESNADLLSSWSDQLAAFGDQALDHLDDVSQAPASADLLDLSEEVVAAIDADTTDPGLIVARRFATTVAEALTLSLDGDQDGAINAFFGLQEQREELTATLDRLGS